MLLKIGEYQKGQDGEAGQAIRKDRAIRQWLRQGTHETSDYAQACAQLRKPLRMSLALLCACDACAWTGPSAPRAANCYGFAPRFAFSSARRRSGTTATGDWPKSNGCFSPARRPCSTADAWKPGGRWDCCGKGKPAWNRTAPDRAASEERERLRQNAGENCWNASGKLEKFAELERHVDARRQGCANAARKAN